MRSKSLKLSSQVSHLEKLFWKLHQFGQNCKKIDFLYPCMLTLTVMISEMGLNCLSCGLLSQQKHDSIIGF